MVVFSYRWQREYFTGFEIETLCVKFDEGDYMIIIDMLFLEGLMTMDLFCFAKNRALTPLCQDVLM